MTEAQRHRQERRQIDRDAGSHGGLERAQETETNRGRDERVAATEMQGESHTEMP